MSFASIEHIMNVELSHFKTREGALHAAMAVVFTKLVLATTALLPACGGVETSAGSGEFVHSNSLPENEVHVRQLNGPNGDGAHYDLTGPFAHLSTAEFQSSVLMPERMLPMATVEKKGRDGVAAQVVDLPESFDWRDKGAVAPVRDQGALGSCWAISTAEAVEGQLAKAAGKLTPLSPEQLVECDARVDASCDGKGPTPPTHLGCADCGVFGGWPYLAYDYLKEAGGMFSEAAWPYRHTGVYPCMPGGYNKRQCGNHDDLHCQPNTTKGQGPDGLCHARSGFSARVTGWHLLSANETELAVQLVERGPVSVLLQASTLQFYRSGIWKGGLLGCKPEPGKGILGLDHAVLLIGYGVDRTFGGGETPYWLLKNSWGTSWGEHGLFRMLRGKGICGIGLMPTLPDVDLPADVVEVAV